MQLLRLAVIFVLISAFFTTTHIYAQDEDIVKLEKIIQNCNEVVNEIMQMPDKSIPSDLLSKCAAVAVFPYVLKGGFFIGARYGKGVILAHDPKAKEWKPPAFFTIAGGSFGFQFGAQSIDLVLVIMNKRGLEGLLKDKFTLGGDAAVAAGPIGRNVSADTDLLLKASIFSYSRSKGLFAGVALNGAVIMPDKKANRRYYGGPVDAKEIILGDRIIPLASSRVLIDTLSSFTK